MASKLPEQAYQSDDTPVPAYHSGSGPAFPTGRSFTDRLPQADTSIDPRGSQSPPATPDRMPYPMPGDTSDRGA